MWRNSRDFRTFMPQKVKKWNVWRVFDFKYSIHLREYNIYCTHANVLNIYSREYNIHSRECSVQYTLAREQYKCKVRDGKSKNRII